MLEKINELKDEHKQVLLLKYVDEFTVEEIASQLGKTTNNVRVILFRAREAIKTFCEKEHQRTIEGTPCPQGPPKFWWSQR